MTRELRNLDWLIKKNMFDKLVYNNETNFFLLDTGTLIDIEDSYHNNGKKNEYFPVRVLENIERVLSEINENNSLIITPGVWNEVKRKKESRKNIRYEIAPSTVQLIKQFYDDSSEKIEDIVINDPLREKHRYDTTLAAFHTFKEDYRKGEKDEISFTDIELISLSLDLANVNYQGKPISSVNILSTDSHISQTMNTLKNEGGYNDYNVRAIHTRGDLRSYLRK